MKIITAEKYASACFHYVQEHMSHQVHAFCSCPVLCTHLNKLGPVTCHKCLVNEINEKILDFVEEHKDDMEVIENELIIGIDEEYHEQIRTMLQESPAKITFITTSPDVEHDHDHQVHVSRSSFDYFEQVFNASPGNFLVLDLNFDIVASSDDYLLATNTKREEVLGKNLFDIFPDNPNDLTANGTSNLRQSLQTVIETKKPHTMHSKV